MIECKVVHIHDGDKREMTNGNWHTGGEYDWAGEMIALYLNAGYRIEQIIPDFCPAPQQPGTYTFYKDGFTVVFVREAGSGEEITEEDWEALNVMSPQREAMVAAAEEEEAAAFSLLSDEDFDDDEFGCGDADDGEEG